MNKIIQNTIKKAKKDKEVIAIAIFGSYARNESYHDIDLCIFLKNKKYNKAQLSKKKLKYASESEKYDIQIFQQLPIYIRKRILKDAKILYCKDEDMLYDLYFQTIKEFDDFKPLYESYLGVVENG